MTKNNSTKELMDIKHTCKSILVDKLKEFVRLNGDDFAFYDRNVFGIDEDEEEGVTVTKIYNFYDNGGCYFPVQLMALCDVKTDCSTVDELLEECNNAFEYYAFQCLYIVNDEDGEHLKYYTLYNDGIDFKDGLSEPDHEYVQNLPLNIVCQIVDVIEHIESKPNESKTK